MHDRFPSYERRQVGAYLIVRYSNHRCPQTGRKFDKFVWYVADRDGNPVAGRSTPDAHHSYRFPAGVPAGPWVEYAPLLGQRGYLEGLRPVGASEAEKARAVLMDGGMSEHAAESIVRAAGMEIPPSGGIGGVFDPGRIWIHLPSIHGVGKSLADVTPILRRYVKGDMGSLGTFDDDTLKDGRQWCPAAYGPAAESADAVRTRDGIVRAVYPAFDPARVEPKLSGPGVVAPANPSRPDDTITVATLLRPDGRGETRVLGSRDIRGGVRFEF